MTIYIRPDGTISGSNEPLPKEPNQCGEGSKKCIDPDEVCWCVEDYSMYLSKLAAWKESCIDFEDQEAIAYHPEVYNFLNLHQPKGECIIENMDVETDILKQYWDFTQWRDCGPGKYSDGFDYRTVLRIKDKPKDK